MSDYIPEEILREIIVRLPVRSLLRFTSVCKSWYSIIINPSFISLHLNRTLANRKSNDDKLLLRVYTNNDRKEHYFLLSDDDKFGDEYMEIECPIKSYFGYFRIVGRCNGLICFCDDYFRDAQNVIIWNPSIRKTVSLPMPYKPQRPHMFVLGFGAHPITHEYKVVRIVYEKEDLHRFKVPSEVEIYTQATGKWKGVNSAPPPYCMVEFSWSQVFLNGAVHWIAYDPSVVGAFRSLIVSFDMGEEVFREVILPSALAEQRPTYLSVASFGESLAVLSSAQMGRGASCVWVMKDFGLVESWTKLYSVNLPGVLDRTLGFRKNGEVLLSTTYNSLLSFDPGTRTIMNTGITGSSYSFNVDTFMESLVLLKDKVVVPWRG